VRLGAAAGGQKADVVLAALRGRFVTVLVVDEEIADAILKDEVP
jgi:DNA-binding transcriptional regulator LsrR (DeoR family)